MNSSDVPGGVVNILTGFKDELYKHFGTHMDVNAIICCSNNKEHIKSMQESAALNVKRFILRNKIDWTSEKGQDPYFILDTQEIKTAWHPIGL